MAIIDKSSVILELLLKADKADKDLGKLNKKADGIGNSFSRAKKIFKTIVGVAAVALAVRGIGRMIRSSINLAASFESTNIQFETLVGNTKEAVELIKQLEDFSISTPFTPDEINESAKLLLSFGTEAKDVQEELRGIGSVASAIGKPLGDISVIFGKVQAKGKLMGEELQSFRENGIPVIDLLAESAGKSEEEIVSLQAAGKIAFADLRKAFVDASIEGGKFESSLRKQSTTLEGLRSTLTGVIDIVGRRVGQFFLPAMRVVTSEFIKIFTSVNDQLGELSESNGANRFAAGVAGAFAVAIEFVNNFQIDLKVTAKLLQTFGEDVQFTGGQIAQFFKNAGNLALGLPTSSIDFNALKKQNAKEFDDFKKETEKEKADLSDTYKRVFAEALEEVSKQPEEVERQSKKVGEGIANGVGKGTEERFDIIADDIAQSAAQAMEDAFARLTLPDALPLPGFQAGDIDTSSIDLQEQQRIASALEISNATERNAELEAIESEFQRKRIEAQLQRFIITDQSVSQIKALENELVQLTLDAEDTKTRIVEEESRKRKEAAINGVESIVSSTLNGLSQINAAQESQVNKDISLQEKRISGLLRTAEDGNAEQLQLEEERLARLQEQKEAASKKQRAIDLLDFVSSSALAVSKAAAAGPPAAFALIPAIIGALALGVAKVKSLQLAEGTEYVRGPGTATSDSIPANLSRGERVVPTKINQHLRGISNSDLPKLAALAKSRALIPTGNKAPKDNTGREMLKALNGLNERMDSLEMNVFLDKKGFRASMKKDEVRELKKRRSIG